ncbi:MAG: tRNA 4-thiouridine(8) synthase ThiI [Bacillaceae bacterium]|nr:tRNA 4-thiouridine(8) synthase ThiI [Bacillaceae bacterium]
MKFDHILIRYGELALKKKNRSFFEKQLVNNLKNALKMFPQVEIHKTYGRMHVVLNDTPFEEVAQRIQQVFGIVSFSPVIKTDLDLEKIKEASLNMISQIDPAPKTFKVETNRANKQFPHKSMELNHLIGSHILRNTQDLKVDVHEPDVKLRVDVRTEGVFISSYDIPGIGGLPVGVSGKAMLMLSGGIDSPVAGWLTMKRGVTVEAVHFHSYPFTSQQARDKVIELARIMSRYSGRLKLHLVPLTEIQTLIRQRCPEDYTITIMRRMMMRITEKLAEKNGALAISTGESLAQVASQTMESMNTINRVVRLPVIRPLVTMDKLEIMEIARKIGTYETSIQPYEDCCTIFVPKSPVTRPTPEKAEKFEQALEVEELVQDAVERTEVMWITPEEPEDEFDLF